MTMPDSRPYILVVEDNKITAKLMRRYLEANGFEAEEVYDGLQALARIKERKPDAILMDVMMPKLDGFGTVQAIRTDAATKDIPVAIITALNDTATQVRAVECGADDFLTKPIEEKLIITKARVLTSLTRHRKQIDAYRSIINALLQGRRNEVEEDLRQEGFDLP